MSGEATANDVAAWMLEEVKTRRALDQSDAAHGAVKRFGREFVVAKGMSEGIAEAVLRAFRKLAGDDVVWSRGDRAWRLRHERDRPGWTQE